MSKRRSGRRKRNKKKKIAGCGLGPHQEASPMGHATTTKSKQDVREQEDRKAKQLLNKSKEWFERTIEKYES